MRRRSPVAGNLARLDVLLFELFVQFGYQLEQIADKSVIGDGKDRRLFVLIDCDDHFGILHARQVLDRPGNTDGDIQFRGDDLAGLADLVVVGLVAGIDRGAGCANGGALAESGITSLRRAA